MWFNQVEPKKIYIRVDVSGITADFLLIWGWWSWWHVWGGWGAGWVVQCCDYEIPAWEYEVIIWAGWCWFSNWYWLNWWNSTFNNIIAYWGWGWGNGWNAWLSWWSWGWNSGAGCVWQWHNWGVNVNNWRWGGWWAWWAGCAYAYWWAWWIWIQSDISWTMEWYAWGWWWAEQYYGCCTSCWWCGWGWKGTMFCNNKLLTRACYYWWWWGGADCFTSKRRSSSCPAIWYWYQWIFILRYPTACWYNVTWWTCYTCWNYTIHCFTSNGTLVVN